MESRKNERLCPWCHRWFNAWDSYRMVCRQCQPDDPKATKWDLWEIQYGRLRLTQSVNP